MTVENTDENNELFTTYCHTDAKAIIGTRIKRASKDFRNLSNDLLFYAFSDKVTEKRDHVHNIFFLLDFWYREWDNTYIYNAYPCCYVSVFRVIVVNHP